jgi:uncharacterized damage-inducible protein DinB
MQEIIEMRAPESGCEGAIPSRSARSRYLHTSNFLPNDYNLWRTYMFRQLDDFMKAYENLNEGSTRVLAMLTDEHLEQPVAPGHRTLGQVAWHIVTTIPEMMNRTGLALSSVAHESSPPASALEISDAYKQASTELIDAIKANWNDDSLLQSDEMYGEQWPRGMTVAALIGHEVHHRGQMTVLLRQAGQQVPGVFGPAKEEWSQFGMEAPPY